MLSTDYKFRVQKMAHWLTDWKRLYSAAWVGHFICTRNESVVECWYMHFKIYMYFKIHFLLLASYIFGPSGKLMVELCVIGYLMG